MAGRTLFAITFLSMLAISCLDPYSPPPHSLQTDFIVIDGHINTTANEVTVKISRSLSLVDTSKYPPVIGASVLIEDDNANFLLVGESSSGTYSSSHVFDKTLNYRLKVNIEGTEYLSEFIKIEPNTPIDSLTWEADETGLEIFVNNKSLTEGHKYYRYNFDETYKYTSAFTSTWKLQNSVPAYRENDEQIYECWITKPSTAIIVTSTENLTQNTISEFTIARIPRGDRRLWHQHSLLVRQYALSKEAFTYWSQLSKITESLGGLFDPLPYQINGNLSSSSNPNEIVLGYFSGGDVSEKRVVVGNNELPKGYGGALKTDCVEDYVTNAQLSTLVNTNAILTRPEYMGIFIIGFHYSEKDCVDCRLENGTNVIPDFFN